MYILHSGLLLLPLDYLVVGQLNLFLRGSAALLNGLWLPGRSLKAHFVVPPGSYSRKLSRLLLTQVPNLLLTFVSHQL
jgi:hypothetical protein